MTATPWAALRRQARELFRAFEVLLLAARCPACGEPRDRPGLCGGCAHLLERRPPPVCRRCGEPLVAPEAACPVDHGFLAGIAAFRAPLRYRGTGARLVHRLKFQGDLIAGRYLCSAMAGAAAGLVRREARRALVVAVPRHRSKLRGGGFDQAAWLATAVSRRLGLGAPAAALARTRATLPQADPRVTSREANVAGAFACRRPGEVAGRTVLLVDDVLTSGATARACAAALRDAGAGRVLVLTGARA